MRALFVVTDGFEDIEYTATRDVLKRGGISTVTVSGRLHDRTRPIVGKEGAEVVSYKEIDAIDPSDFDLLVIPGGPQVPELKANPKVLALVKWYMAHPEKYVAAICAAPTILGELGYLKGRDYTVFPTMDGDFGGRFHRQYAVVDGHLITGDGPAAAIAFGLAILKTVLGEDVRDQVASGMFYQD